MLVYLLLTTALMGSPNCNKPYDFPESVKQLIAREEGEFEVVKSAPNGYIESLFIGKVFMEGWFIQDERGLVACDVSFVLKLDETGKAIFQWRKGDREAYNHNPWYGKTAPWIKEDK